jgi:hypothetical protein
MARTRRNDIGHIYGVVNSAADIRRINRVIRKEMDRVTAREELTELKKRSDYLCTLTASPSWRKKFGSKINVLLRVAREENRRTVEHANRIAMKHGWRADYDPWGPDGPSLRTTRDERPAAQSTGRRTARHSAGSKMKTHYKPTTARYSGGGKVKYLIYRSPQPLRSGATQLRSRVKRVYFPRSARRIRMERPKTVTTRSGKRVYGVLVRYEEHLGPTRARRNETTYTLPARWVDRTKIVTLPRNAKNVRLRDRAPQGPLLAVA